MSSNDTAEVWKLLKQHSRETFTGIIDFVQQNYSKLIEAFIQEDVKPFRKILADVITRKDLLKKRRRGALLALRRIETNVAIEKNTWFHLANNNAEQMIYCLRRMAEPCKEHTENNFNPLPDTYAKEFLSISKMLEAHMQSIRTAIETSNYSDYHQLFFTCKNFSEQFSRLRHNQIERIHQGDSENLNVSLVYLNLLQESQELASLLRYLLRASRKFQKE